MATIRERILQLVRVEPGLTDREITKRDARQQTVNHECRLLEAQGPIVRQERADGLIGNYPADAVLSGQTKATPASGEVARFEEDAVKLVLEQWLRSQGWVTEVAWGRSHGLDIRATRAGHRWLIEVKGEGAHAQARVNYFLGVLGELLQGMGDADARYSVALPDLPQFRALWDRLPPVAKARTGITALFVRSDGSVTEGQ